MPTLEFGVFFHCAKFICSYISMWGGVKKILFRIDESFQVTCPGGVIGTVLLRICSVLVLLQYFINLLLLFDATS